MKCSSRAMDEGRKPTIDDAVEYLQYVKRKFHDEPEKYDEFIQILKDVRAERVDEDGGKARVKELMKGHRMLLVGFNFFFPGAEITIPPKAEESVEDSWDFIFKLKTKFQGENRYVYKSIVEILKKCDEGNKSDKDAQEEIISLLYFHNDLLKDFSRFLGTQIIPPEKLTISDTLNFLSKVKERFEGDDGHVYESFVKLMKTWKKEGNMSKNKVQKEILRLFWGHQDLIEYVSTFLPAGYIDFRF